jgi:hypothetical protein
LEPSFSRALQVSLVVNTFSATAIIWNALFGLASAASFDHGGGVASWTRHIGGGWTIAGASASFDVSWAHEDFAGFNIGIFKHFDASDDGLVTARADWIFWHGIGDFKVALTWFLWFRATFTVVAAFVAILSFTINNVEDWFVQWARNWSWHGETEKFQCVCIANFCAFGNGVVGSTFENGASIIRVPNLSDVVVLTFVGTLFTVSGHAAITLNELWV